MTEPIESSDAEHCRTDAMRLADNHLVTACAGRSACKRRLVRPNAFENVNT